MATRKASESNRLKLNGVTPNPACLVPTNDRTVVRNADTEQVCVTSPSITRASQSLSLNKVKASATMPSQRISVVSITKRENGGLGFLIRQRNSMPFFAIWEIIKNGAAEKCGKIRKGDIILRVNNEDLENQTYERGLEILKSIKPGTTVNLTLLSGVPECFDDDQINDKNESTAGQHSDKVRHIQECVDASNANNRVGLMSPLQKFKKKFITCASNNDVSFAARDYKEHSYMPNCSNTLPVQSQHAPSSSASEYQEVPEAANRANHISKAAQQPVVKVVQNHVDKQGQAACVLVEKPSRMNGVKATANELKTSSTTASLSSGTVDSSSKPSSNEMNHHYQHQQLQQVDKLKAKEPSVKAHIAAASNVIQHNQITYNDLILDGNKQIHTYESYTINNLSAGKAANESKSKVKQEEQDIMIVSSDNTAKPSSHFVSASKEANTMPPAGQVINTIYINKINASQDPAANHAVNVQNMQSNNTSIKYFKAVEQVDLREDGLLSGKAKLMNGELNSSGHSAKNNRYESEMTHLEQIIPVKIDEESEVSTQCGDDLAKLGDLLPVYLLEKEDVASDLVEFNSRSSDEVLRARLEDIRKLGISDKDLEALIKSKKIRMDERAAKRDSKRIQDNELSLEQSYSDLNEILDFKEAALYKARGNSEKRKHRNEQQQILNSSQIYDSEFSEQDSLSLSNLGSDNKYGLVPSKHLPNDKYAMMASANSSNKLSAISKSQRNNLVMPNKSTSSNCINAKNLMNTIQIIQDGDDLRISIDGGIEIRTNRSNNKKFISLSPQLARKPSTGGKSSQACPQTAKGKNSQQMLSPTSHHLRQPLSEIESSSINESGISDYKDVNSSNENLTVGSQECLKASEEKHPRSLKSAQEESASSKKAGKQQSIEKEKTIKHSASRSSSIRQKVSRPTESPIHQDELSKRNKYEDETLTDDSCCEAPDDNANKMPTPSVFDSEVRNTASQACNAVSQPQPAPVEVVENPPLVAKIKASGSFSNKETQTNSEAFKATTTSTEKVPAVQKKPEEKKETLVESKAPTESAAAEPKPVKQLTAQHVIESQPKMPSVTPAPISNQSSIESSSSIQEHSSKPAAQKPEQPKMEVNSPTKEAKPTNQLDDSSNQNQLVKKFSSNIEATKKVPSLKSRSSSPNVEALQSSPTKVISSVFTSSGMSGQQSGCPASMNNKKKKGTKLRFLLNESTTIDTLNHKSITKVACSAEKCHGSLLQPTKITPSYSTPKEETIEQAVDFINQFYASVKREGSKTHKERLDEVINSINACGSYELKETELCFGARTAWRNAPRCIGRISWSKLQVFDARYVTTARGMFEAICNHLKYVTNKGNIRSAITIFKQRTEPGHDFRVWNSQFIQYAGYKISEDVIIGDRAQVEFTELCQKIGWKGKMTEFDVLPIVLQANGQDPEWFEIPQELILEVDLVHPKFDWFAELKLKWYAVPAVTSMMLDIGGLQFTACPFNGWYMGTEIGRDLADINRYDKLGVIAERMGLDIRTNTSLWKDKALVELNHAILYSYQKCAVTIVDHHSAAESFMKHYENENQLRGGCPGDWVWVVPPLSSHLTPVFHLEMLNYNLKPSYEYQEQAWKNHVWKQQKTQGSDEKVKRTRKRVYFSDIARAVKFSAKLMGKALARRVKCTILYATETGKSERFAKLLAEIFKHAFDAKTLCMKDYDVVDLEHETLLLIVTSTFGNGDPPENGEEFKKILSQMKKEQMILNKSMDAQSPNEKAGGKSLYEYSGALSNVRFSVFGLGNSSYPKYCSYGIFLDACFEQLGAERVHKLGLGDELCGQEESFRTWSVGVYKSAVETFCIDTDTSFVDSLSNDELGWSPQTVRLTLVDGKESPNLCESLSKLHGRKILPCMLANRKNLQTELSDRKTHLIELNTQGHTGELQYKPGDHIGIFAQNRKELVDAILAKVANAPPCDQLVKVEILKEKPTVFGVSKQWIVDERYPICTLREALTNFLDITSAISQNMLMYLSTQASNETDRVQLEKLGKDHLAYEEWRLNEYPNFVEVLNEFPSLRPHASLLVTQLPKLQPRFYSISSSPKCTDDIHLTVGVVEYKLPGKTMHYGVCSKWLDEIDPGTIVPAFVRGAPSFRLPEDKTMPIIMVGAGTGIAPFRSFWQERKVDMEMNNANVVGVNGSGWASMVLYFGCRRPDHDDLYRSEVEPLVEERVIQNYYPAYSREPNKEKTYVQHILRRNTKFVYDSIYKKSGHFYVCGDVRMAADVTNTLEEALQHEGRMSSEDAKKYVNEMKENLRFHEDIFGINVTTSVSTNHS